VGPEGASQIYGHAVPMITLGFFAYRTGTDGHYRAYIGPSETPIREENVRNTRPSVSNSIFAHSPVRHRSTESSEFIVNAIIDHKPRNLTRSNIQRATFRVLWEGFPRSQSTWERYVNLTIRNIELRRYLNRIGHMELIRYLEEET
jgi:Chromo (CHRromatin Organisation MOdifier) domain